MGYYSNGTSVNLYNGASSRYPTSGGTYACQKGQWSKASTPSYSLTVTNNGGSLIGGSIYVYYSNGTKIGDRLLNGTTTLYADGSVSGYNSGTATNFYADGTQMYYGGSNGTASNPTIYVKVSNPGVSGTDEYGNTFYKGGYLKVGGTIYTTWGYTTSSATTSNITISNNTSITLERSTGVSSLDGVIGYNSEGSLSYCSLSFTKSGSTSQNWTTKKASTKSLYQQSGKTYCYFHYRSTGNTTTISFTGTAWSGSQKVSYSSTSYCNVTSITRTQSACSFSVTKGTSITYTIYWNAEAYSERD